MPTASESFGAPKPNLKHAAPALQLSECPSCGRKAVVVLIIPAVHDPDGTHRVVCVHCCPKPPDRNRP